MATYTVKSGDTLSGIAKNLGVQMSDITGFKSGNPNKIYSGENLSIGGTPKSNEYVGAVKESLGGSSSTASPQEDYLTGLRTKIDNAQKEVDTSSQALKNLRTNTYNTAYTNAGLDGIKKNISDIDNVIATKKAERDAQIAKVRNNPGLSAALLTGTVKKTADAYNNEINNLVGQRNTYANEYNSGLTKIDREVSNTVGDAEALYNAALKSLSGLTTNAKDYQTNLIDTLKYNSDKDYKDKSLEVAMMNAKANQERAAKTGSSVGSGSDSYSLSINPLTGLPQFWYSKKGQINPLTDQQKEMVLPKQNITPVVEDTPKQSFWQKIKTSLGF